MPTLPESSQLIRLFVSSTFADFTLERDVLQRAVFPKLRAICAAQGYRFQPIDLRWGVSKEAGNEKRTLAICFDEIRRCQELSPDLNMLILLGGRYGSCFLPASIPSAQVARLLPHLSSADRTLFDPSSPDAVYREEHNAVPAEYVLLPTPPSGRDEEALRLALGHATQAAGFSTKEVLPFVASATHLEIQRGLLAESCNPDSVLCAFRTFTPTPTGPRATDFVEQDPSRRTQVEALTGAVQTRLGGRALRYTRPWGADGPPEEEAAHTALAERFLGLLEPRVRDVIAQRQAANQERDPVAVANRRFAATRTTVIAGRDDALAEIAAYLAGDTALPLVVTGVSGVGKSTLLAQAMADAAQAHPEAVVVTRYVGITPGTGSLADLLSGLRREIATRSGQPDPDPLANLSQLIAAVAAELETLAVPAEHPLVVVVVDALDQLSTQPQRVEWLPRVLAPQVRVVVSVLSDRKELADLRTWLPEAQVLTLGPLTSEQGAAVLHQWLAEEGRALQPAQAAAVLAGFAPTGNPLYLRLAFEEARTWRSFASADLPAPLPPFPPTIPALLDRLFDRLEENRNHGPALTAHALGDLGAAKNGLAEDELLDVLGRDEAVSKDLHRLNPDAPPVDPRRQLPLPVVLWARLSADLERTLTVDGTRLVTFYHRQVRDAAELRYLQGADGVARHYDLAVYLGEQAYRLGRDGGEGVWNRRKLAEMAFQQEGEGPEGQPKLKETLTDARYLEGKLAVEGANATLEDLGLLRADEAVRQIAWVVGGWASSLEDHPEEVTNQVVGRRFGAPVLHDQPWEDGRSFLRLLHPTLPGDPALVHVLEGHTNKVWGCAFGPDGRLALSASEDKTLRVWDVESGRELRVLAGHTDRVADCAFGPDGRLALSASDDRTLRLWDVVSGRELRRFEGHDFAVYACALSPDGRLALSGSADKTLRVWDVESGRELRRFEADDIEVRGCVFSPDGRLALSTSTGHETLRLWDLGNGQELHPFEGDTLWVNACAFSPDGRLALSASGRPSSASTSDEQAFRLWEVESRRELHRFKGHTFAVMACKFSPDGRLALSASRDRTLRVWDMASVRSQRLVAAHYGIVRGCVLSADGRLALSAEGGSLGSDNTLRLWDVESGRELRRFEGHRDGVNACALSPDGRLALSGSADKTLRVWDVASAQTLRVLEGHTAAVEGCVLSADGRLALSASRDQTLRVWDVQTGYELARWWHEESPGCCALSQDGLVAVAGDWRGGVHFLELLGTDLVPRPVAQGVASSESVLDQLRNEARTSDGTPAQTSLPHAAQPRRPTPWWRFWRRRT